MIWNWELMENFLVKRKMNTNVLANVEPMNNVKDFYLSQKTIRHNSKIAFLSGILVHLTFHILLGKATKLDTNLVEMITTQLKVTYIKYNKNAILFPSFHTFLKVRTLSKNSILTKYFHEFLVKSKLSSAKKSKTQTFSRVFHPHKIIIVLAIYA